MHSICTFLLALLGCLGLPAALASQGAELVPEPVAQQHGLTRAWSAQVEVDPSRGYVSDVVLDDGVLFVQTNRAVLHAIDAATGQTLWAQQIGAADYPSLTPGANATMVSVINGSTLYVLNRFTGKVLWKVSLESAAGSGPALSQQRVYVPLLKGLIASYRLKMAGDPMKELGKAKRKEARKEEISPGDLKPAKKDDSSPDDAKAVKKDQKKSAPLLAADLAARGDTLQLEKNTSPPVTCHSLGRTMVQPLITRQNNNEEYVVWTSEQGILFVASVDRAREADFKVRYRLTTGAPIVARPSYMPPDPTVTGDAGIIFATSQDGFVHALCPKDGNELWRFSTGEPISESAAIVEQAVCVTNPLGGMYCLNAKTGAQAWWRSL